MLPGAPVTSPAAFSDLDTASAAQERSLAELPDAAERVQDYAGRSKSAATIKAYASGWRDFLDFCAERELSALPASDQTVALYLSAMADRGAKAATIARRLVVISQAHKGADLASPTRPAWCAACTPASAAPSAPPRSAKPRPGRRSQENA